MLPKSDIMTTVRNNNFLQIFNLLCRLFIQASAFGAFIQRTENMTNYQILHTSLSVTSLKPPLATAM
jgi:hypothetical protein